ncbi:hypothetical protein [Brytella acorum]|uniref:Hydrophobic W protein n=1 Tax=Brytella acorum TaxID=2959299 RepID=A0AA35UGP6_9PROT|nr:hypothetical protein [Brytella acorum]MDF3624601.1 hypothetical protein [Brytella acorum]CAI9120957.1 hypothetical protein LMG32879_001799 [Brytella acorum]
MSQPETTPAPHRVVDLKAEAHLMTLNPGLFCVFYAPGQPIGATGGFPGARISRPPHVPATAVTISTMNPDGWLGATDGAALIRVLGKSADVMVTLYALPGAQTETPRLQVVQLGGQTAPAAAAQPAATGSTAIDSATPKMPKNGKAEIAAHVQRRGDVGTKIGEWMGVPGSQAWIEGFGIAPVSLIDMSDIEYQAVLGKGWLSPWVEGGQYCGSRGMALPILGLRVRLKGSAADKFDIHLSATFTDGARVGPVGGDIALEADSLAPLEAFLLEITPKGTGPKVATGVDHTKTKDGKKPLEAARDASEIATMTAAKTPSRKTAVSKEKAVPATPKSTPAKTASTPKRSPKVK